MGGFALLTPAPALPLDPAGAYGVPQTSAYFFLAHMSSLSTRNSWIRAWMLYNCS
jgi:hypothetical protein